MVNLRFAETTPSPINEPIGWMSYLQFTKDDIMHWAEELVMAILAIVVLLMVVRPLVNRIITPDQPFAIAALAGADASAALVAAEKIAAVPSATAKMIDIAQVQGQVHAQSVQKVGELANRNPNETVSIIRQWLQDAPN